MCLSRENTQMCRSTPGPELGIGGLTNHFVFLTQYPIKFMLGYFGFDSIFDWEFFISPWTYYMYLIGQVQQSTGIFTW